MRTLILTLFLFGNLVTQNAMALKPPREICPPGYITPKGGPDCSYEQKSRSTALTLSVLVPGGSAQFYTKDYLVGSIFAVLAVSGVGGVIGLTRFTPKTSGLAMVLSLGASFALFVPWAVSIWYFSKTDATDSNGYALSNNRGLNLGVFFENLVHSAEVPLTFPVRAATKGLDLITEGAANFVVLIDQAESYIPIGQVIGDASYIVHFPTGQQEGVLTLSSGPHDLTLQLVNEAGISYGDRFAQKISVLAQ